MDIFQVTLEQDVQFAHASSALPVDSCLFAHKMKKMGSEYIFEIPKRSRIQLIKGTGFINWIRPLLGISKMYSDPIFSAQC
jgi:hypothetical protein